MTDEHALHRDIDRAGRAKTLLEDALLIEAFDRIEADYIKGWRDSTARDTDARERLWQAVQVIGKVREHLKVLVRGGTLARAELDQIRARG